MKCQLMGRKKNGLTSYIGELTTLTDNTLICTKIRKPLVITENGIIGIPSDHTWKYSDGFIECESIIEIDKDLLVSAGKRDTGINGIFSMKLSSLLNFNEKFNSLKNK